MDAKDIFKDVPEKLRKKFKTYHQENPDIYFKFKELSEELYLTGRKKYSAHCIMNKIRWDYDIKTSDKTFKINNDYIPVYARLLMYQYPKFRYFFNIRSHSRTEYYESNEERKRKGELDNE